MQAVFAFALYLVASLLLLGAFIFTYTKVTPYDDFALIREDNMGAAIILAGAVLGFTFPLLSAIYFTHSLIEMGKWALLTGAVQLVFIGMLRRVAGTIERGHMAPAVLVAVTAIAIGLLNAISISY